MEFKTSGSGEKAIRVQASLSKGRWSLCDPEMKRKVKAQKQDWMKFFLYVREQSRYERNGFGKYGETYEQGAMTAQRYFPKKGHMHAALWRVTIGPEAFFVKETNCHTNRLGIDPICMMSHSGPVQYISLLALTFARTAQVRVIKPYFAFWSKRDSFLVTEFIEFDTAMRMGPDDTAKLMTFQKEVCSRYGDRFADIVNENALPGRAGEVIVTDPYDMKYYHMSNEWEWREAAQKVTLNIKQNGGWLKEEFFRP